MGQKLVAGSDGGLQGFAMTLGCTLHGDVGGQ
jgi:hypothetical protein